MAAVVFAVTVIRPLLADAGPSADPAPAGGRPPLPPPDSQALARLCTDVADALRSRSVYHHTLRPQLYALAADLLAHRDLRAADDHDVRALVGDKLWPLLDPAAAWTRALPDVQVAQLQALFDRLEEVA